MNNTTGKAVWTQQLEEEVDYQFIQRVQQEVTQSCALPFALPAERIVANIRLAAQLHWQMNNYAAEERYYVIRNKDICRGNTFNKIAQLPPQVLAVHGCYKIQQAMSYGPLGDFSLERVLLSSYSMFGGTGVVGNGFTGNGNVPGYTLSDMVMSLYEVDTFENTLNPTLSYNYNPLSSKLVILGDMGWSDILICCSVRCRIQDLYNDYFFFKTVVALCKKNLSTIYGMYEFKYPGGVTINYDKLNDQAETELDEVKEYFENNNVSDYFFMPNTL